MSHRLIIICLCQDAEERFRNTEGQACIFAHHTHPLCALMTQLVPYVPPPLLAAAGASITAGAPAAGISAQAALPANHKQIMEAINTIAAARMRAELNGDTATVNKCDVSLTALKSAAAAAPTYSKPPLPPSLHCSPHTSSVVPPLTQQSILHPLHVRPPSPLSPFGNAVSSPT